MDAEAFANQIHQDLARRKVELTRVRVEAPAHSADADDLRSWTWRAAIAISYAHWEGFVKAASAHYIEFINTQDIPVNSLHICFQAAFLKGHFKRCWNSEKTSYLGSVLSDIDGHRTMIFRLHPAKIVDTESNLSSTVFRELVSSLGLEYLEEYETRQNFIDEKLVHSRNQVVHGELVRFTMIEASERIDGVLSLVDRFADQLIDAVQDIAYINKE